MDFIITNNINMDNLKAMFETVVAETVEETMETLEDLMQSGNIGVEIPVFTGDLKASSEIDSVGNEAVLGFSGGKTHDDKDYAQGLEDLRYTNYKDESLYFFSNSVKIYSLFILEDIINSIKLKTGI